MSRFGWWFGVSVVASGSLAAQAAPATLPLHEVRAVRPGDRLALLVSGDGGWAGIDKAIAGALADSGVSVIGLDARAYLGTRRSPEEVTRDLAGALRSYLAAWGRERVILIGYSRGAVIVPFVATRLPDDLHRRLDLVAMLGLGYHAGFHVGFTDLFRTTTNRKDAEVRPEIEALGRDGVPMICVYGESEKESLCRDGTDLPLRRIARTGAHHFDGDHRGLAAEILAALRS